jgi:hypothetical protein
MKRYALAAGLLLAACTQSFAQTPELRGTGDLGLIIERAAGSVLLVENSTNTRLAEIPGLGDLSHAAAVFSRDGRYAFVFGRDGGLTKVDLLTRQIARAHGPGRQQHRRRHFRGWPADRSRQLRTGRGARVRRRHARRRGRHPDRRQGGRAGGRAGQPFRLQPVRRGRNLAGRPV